MHKARKNISLNKLQAVLRRFHNTPLGLYSYFISNGRMDLLRRSKVLRTSAVAAVFLLVLLTSAVLVPLYNKLEITEAATGTAKESSLSFNLTNSTASVDLSVNDTNGTFASSSDDNSKVKFNISTTNYTGYTLSIQANNNNQQLINSGNSNIKLNSISSTINYDSFNSNSDYNNLWGYLPSKLNSSTNTNYLPAPTTTASTLDKTTTANSTANSYTIGIGARASYTTPAGEYTGTYILTVVANNVSYNISFADNSGDTGGTDGTSSVANLPSNLSGSSSLSSLTLPSTIPTRTGYTFVGWCSVETTNSGIACGGDIYDISGAFYFDERTSNIVTLYAVWEKDGYEVFIAKGSGITGVSGGGIYSQGDEITLSATASANTTCLTYDTPTWSVVSGGVTLSDTVGTSVSFIMPDNAVEISVSSLSTRKTYDIVYRSNGGVGTMGNTTASCGETVALRANTFTKANSTFLGWNTSSTATSVRYADKQSVTLNRTNNLTLYAVWEFNGPEMQTMTVSSCTSGSAIEVKDTRDNQIYLAQKLADGKCWLVENLRLGASALVQNLSTDNTNMKTGTTFTLPSSISSNFSSYTEPQINTSRSSSTLSYGSGTGKVGVYYNYCAASAGTVCTESMPGSTNYDICPKGWTMPSMGNGYYSYEDLFEYYYDSNVANFKGALRTVSGGYYQSNKVTDYNSTGHYWTKSNNLSGDSPYTQHMSVLRVGATTVNMGLGVVGATRNKGLSVRCVLK